MATIATECVSLSAHGGARSTVERAPLDPDELRLHGRLLAGRQLPGGRPDLPLDNPLLREPLKLEHVKPRLLGHWGTTPGQNFIYVHLNRVIKEYDLNMIYISGPGHGGPALVANTYLEGTYSEIYPNIIAGRGGHEAAVQAVLLPRRHPQPRRPGDARLDPRGRRAGLQPQPRLRRGVRQPRPDRGLRRRRRRGRDRAAGHRLALQQVPQPGARRGRAADPAPERLQDRQPDRAGAHRPRGARAAAARLRLHPVLRRGGRARGDAPAHGRDARPRHRRNPPHPGRCAGPGRRPSGRAGR